MRFGIVLAALLAASPPAVAGSGSSWPLWISGGLRVAAAAPLVLDTYPFNGQETVHDWALGPGLEFGGEGLFAWGNARGGCPFTGLLLGVNLGAYAMSIQTYVSEFPAAFGGTCTNGPSCNSVTNRSIAAFRAQGAVGLVQGVPLNVTGSGWSGLVFGVSWQPMVISFVSGGAYLKGAPLSSADNASAPFAPLSFGIYIAWFRPSTESWTFGPRLDVAAGASSARVVTPVASAASAVNTDLFAFLGLSLEFLPPLR
jgi:hypothetical protein